MPTVQIYSLPQVVHLTVAGAAGGSSHMSYHHTCADFRLFHGVRNDIDFVIRDSDRRTYALAPGETLTVHISDRDTKRVVLEQELVPVMPEKGHYRLVLGPMALLGASDGHYRYAVTKSDGLGAPVMLFMDRDHGPASIVQILDGPIPARPEPYTIRPDTFIARNGMHYTGAYPGAFLVGNFTGEHTIMAQLVHFTGDITIQASLETDIPNDDVDWFDVETVSFDDALENRPISFNGNFYHVRFAVSTTDGINQIQYQN